MFAMILLILFIPVCVLLTLIVLLQSGKGGGLAGAFGGPGSQAFLGARGAADFLGKLTIYLAIAFMVLAFALSFTYRGGKIRIKEEPAKPQTETTETGAPAGEAAAGSAATQTDSTAGQTQTPSQTPSQPPSGSSGTETPPSGTGSTSPGGQ